MEDEEDAGRWDNLAHDVLVEIFKRLDFEDRYSGVPLVCKLWLNAAMDPACWENADMEKCFDSRQKCAEWWSASFEWKMDAMIKAVVDRSLGRLRELRTRHCSDVAISYIGQRCPMLECLSVKDSSGVTDTAFCRSGASAWRCASLRYLDFSECRHLTPISLKNVAENCKWVSVFKRNLDIEKDCRHTLFHTSYVQIGDEEAVMLGRYMPNLTHLELRQSTLTDVGLSSIVSGCKKLNHLDLQGCTFISQRGLLSASECLGNLKKLIRPRSGMLGRPSRFRY